jgi:hypothetical protein
MPSSAIRWVWLIWASVLALATVVYGAGEVVSLLAHERSHVDSSVSAAVAVVDVHSGGGWVHIVGTDTPGITIDAAISRGLFGPTHHVTTTGNRLSVSASCWPVFNTFCGVDYTLHVPRDVTVVAQSDGGTVTVSGVDGDLTLSSSGGGVTVVGGSGDEHLRSSGGSISVSNVTAAHVDASSSGGGVRVAFAASPTSVSASSSGGGVTVVVPDTSDTYRVSASSSGGSTHNEIRTDPASTKVVSAHSSGGSVTVRYPTP